MIRELSEIYSKQARSTQLDKNVKCECHPRQPMIPALDELLTLQTQTLCRHTSTILPMASARSNPPLQATAPATGSGISRTERGSRSSVRPSTQINAWNSRKLETRPVGHQSTEMFRPDLLHSSARTLSDWCGGYSVPAFNLVPNSASPRSCRVSPQDLGLRGDNVFVECGLVCVDLDPVAGYVKADASARNHHRADIPFDTACRLT